MFQNLKIGMNLPEGRQPAVFADITEYLDDRDRPRLIITWQLRATARNSQGELIRLTHTEMVSASTFPGSKLRSWLLRYLLPPGVDPSKEQASWLLKDVLEKPEALVGKPCVLELHPKDGGRLQLQAISKPDSPEDRVELDKYTRPKWVEDFIGRIVAENELYSKKPEFDVPVPKESSDQGTKPAINMEDVLKNIQ